MGGRYEPHLPRTFRRRPREGRQGKTTDCFAACLGKGAP